jgi:hypothetical protein
MQSIDDFFDGQAHHIAATVDQHIELIELKSQLDSSLMIIYPSAYGVQF